MDRISRRMRHQRVRQLVERLEGRSYLTADFGAVSSKLDSSLGLFQGYVGLTDVKTKLPIVNESLGQIGQAEYLFKLVRMPLVNAVKTIADESVASIQQTIYRVVGPGQGGLNVLKDTDSTPGIDAGDVGVTVSGDDFTVTMSLADSVGVQGTAVTPGTGLPAVPLTFDDGGSATVTPTITGEIDGLSFGWSGGKAFFGSPTGEKGSGGTALVHVAAKISAGTYSGMLGYYPVAGMISPSVTGASDDASALDATFSITANADGSKHAATIAGTAHLELDLASDVPNGGSFTVPDVKVHYVQDQDFGTGSDPNATILGLAANKPAVSMDVQVSVQKLVHNVLQPIADKLDTVLKPIEPVIDALNDPLPVLSDVSKALGGKDISLIDVAQAGIDYETKYGGDISPKTLAAIQSIVDAFNTATKILDVIHGVQELGNTSDFYLSYGSFDLGGTNVDLRDPTQTPRALSQGTITSLTPNGLPAPAEFKTSIAQQLTDNIDGGKDIADFITADYSGPAGSDYVHYDFALPLFNSPLAVDKLLLGQDADLIKFTFDVKPPEAQFTVAKFQVGPIEVEFDADLIFNLHIGVGYDGDGLRQYDVSGDSSDLFQGLYFDGATQISVGGGISAKAGPDVVVFSLQIEGGIDAVVSLGINTDHQGTGAYEPGIAGTDNDITRVRPNELGDTLFKVSGAIKGYLDLHVKIGVKVPFIGFVGYEHTYDIASGTIFSFDISAIPNPFETPTNLNLALLSADGTLTLFTGDARTSVSPANLIDGQSNDSYSIELDSKDTSTLIVSAFGYSQRFQNVKHLIAKGNDDKPLYLDIGKGVTADLSFLGGAYADRLNDQGSGNATVAGNNGDDQLRYTGSGNTTIYGGDGDDAITGGSGQNFIGGDAGNDVITVGVHDLTVGGATVGLNILNGGVGNDTISGAAGNKSYIAGGYGSDDVTAGDQGDLIYADLLPGERGNGFEGNDTITAGAGNDSVFGGGGDDTLNWQAGDGGTAFQGQTGSNSVSFLGSANADTFQFATANLPVGPNGAPLQATAVALAAGKGVLFSDVQSLDLEGLGGSDTINVPNLQGTGVDKLGVDLQDVLSKDNAPDTVTFAPSTGKHAINVFNEGVGVAEVDTIVGGRVTDVSYQYGGVTKIDGVNDYEIRVGNVLDQVTVNTGDANDNVQVYGVSGNTTINAQGGDDTIAISGDSPTVPIVQIGTDTPPVDGQINSGPTFAGKLVLDAGTGAKNKFAFGDFEAGGANVVLNKNTATSALIPQGFTFLATGGAFGGGADVDTGDGADTVTVLATIADGPTTISTGAKVDKIIVGSSQTASQSTLNTIANTLNLDGGADQNTFTLDNSAVATGDANVLLLPNQVLGFAGLKGFQTINFTSTAGSTFLKLIGSTVSALSESFTLNTPNAVTTIMANAGSDTFRVNGLKLNAILDGGAGNDLLYVGRDVSTTAQTLADVNAAISFEGGAGTDRVFIDAAKDAKARQYSAATDELSFGTGLVSLDGAEFATINAGAAGDRLIVNELIGATLNLTFNGGGGTNNVVGPNAVSFWTLTGPGAGTLNTNTLFNQVGLLSGNAAGNTFSLNAGVNTGITIVAQAGSKDGLDYSAWTTGVSVDIAKSTATGLTAAYGVENVNGGKGNDLLRGDAHANALYGLGGNDVLVGGAGSDSLDGGAGNDILIGGDNADTLLGQAGVDLLIDGFTIYDNDNKTLGTASSQWALQLTKTPQLPAVFKGTNKLFHDNYIDRLTGGLNADGFYASISGKVKDLLLDRVAEDVLFA